MDIEQAIAQKQNELTRVQRELEALTLARKVMAAMTGTTARKLAPKLSKPGATSQPQIIEDTLRERGEPMHVNELAQVLSKQIGREVNGTYVSALIYRDVKHGRRFRKVEDAANTFALLEWEAEERAPSHVERKELPPSLFNGNR